MSVIGTLEQHTYPGLPNFQSIARGDEPESGWYLRLATPLCITGNLSEFNTTMASVRVVQVSGSSAEFRRFRQLQGQRISIRGTLFEPGTAHWHTKLALQTVAQLHELQSRRP
jgi:hypothetical protein